MSDPKIEGYTFKPGFRGMAEDTGSDQTMFKGVQWGKVMMWIFLLSDTFIFSCFYDSICMCQITLLIYQRMDQIEFEYIHN